MTGDSIYGNLLDKDLRDVETLEKKTDEGNPFRIKNLILYDS